MLKNKQANILTASNREKNSCQNLRAHSLFLQRTLRYPEGGLSLWQFVEFSLLWRFLAVCGFVQVACQGFLVREACVGVLVGGAVFLLSGVQ